MAWELRARGSRYYTRSRKVGGRVVREYVGGGLIGILAAKLDAALRAERKRDAEALSELRARLERAGDAGRELDDAVDTVTHATFVLAGYHRHHRGEWRKTRARGARHDARS